MSVMRQENQERAIALGAVPVWHSMGGPATFAARQWQALAGQRSHLPKQKGPLTRTLSPNNFVASAVMAMTVMVIMPVVATMPIRDRLKLDVGNSRRDIQPGLALQADGLQRVGILRT